MIAPVIHTPQLTLRPLLLEDWDAYATAWADPEMVRFIGGEPRDRTTSWGKFLMGAGLWPVLGYGYWTFADRKTNAFLGSGGLARFERGVAALEGRVEAGWAFVPAAWGKGYATEAMIAVMGWADSNLPATEIRAIIDHGNVASQRVAAKCGFELLIPALPEMPETALWRREKPVQ